MTATEVKSSSAVTFRRLLSAHWRILGFPVAVLLLFVLLVGANLNGSSLGVIATKSQLENSLIAGTPRDIRSDEFMVNTPLQVGQVESGFPTTKWVGLTDTQIAAGGTAPTAAYNEVFKPYDWGYFTLGASRGLAFHWWLPPAASLIALYALFLLLGSSILGSIAAAVIGTLTPYAGWWMSSLPSAMVAAAAASACFAILAFRARRRRSWVLCSVGVVYCVAATFFLTYPPWLVSVGWVMVAVVVGQAIDTRIKVRRLIGMAAICGAGTLVAVVPWALANKAALVATANTFYPGQRRSTGGGATIELLGSAPYNIWLSTNKVVFSGANNLSENSSVWLPLPVIVIAVALGLWAAFSTPASAEQGNLTTAPRLRTVPSVKWTIITVACVLAGLLIWSFFELPAVVGRVTGMSYVPGTRTPLALGFGAVVLVVLCGTAMRNRRVPRAWWIAVVAAIGLTAWSAYSVGAQLPVIDPVPSLLGPVLGAMLVGLGFFALMLQRQIGWTAAVAAGYCLLSFAVINPLYEGIAPLGSSPVAGAELWSEAIHPASRVAVVGASLTDQIEIRGSDAELVSGMTQYPNRDLMEKLAPTQEADWNNFQHYLWLEDLTVDVVKLERLQLDASKFRFNPCSAQVKAIGIDWYASKVSMKARCLREVGTTGSGKNKLLWYQYR